MLCYAIGKYSSKDRSHWRGIPLFVALHLENVTVRDSCKPTGIAMYLAATGIWKYATQKIRQPAITTIAWPKKSGPMVCELISVNMVASGRG